MNERIKQLSMQAGGSLYPDINSELQQKFAELVIRECIEVIRLQETKPEGFLQPKSADIHELAIQQHFGIK
jgi:hypothetical protein